MKTKNQMIVGVILLVLLCMLACSCNVVNRQAEGPHVPSLQKGCVFSFDGDRTVSRLFAVDGNILAVTQQEPYFSYISVEEKRLMTSFGKKGRAGGELLEAPFCVNYRKGGLQYRVLSYRS